MDRKAPFSDFTQGGYFHTSTKDTQVYNQIERTKSYLRTNSQDEFQTGQQTSFALTLGLRK
jgi:hypothetical protein